MRSAISMSTSSCIADIAHPVTRLENRSSTTAEAMQYELSVARALLGSLHFIPWHNESPTQGMEEEIEAENGRCRILALAK